MTEAANAIVKYSWGYCLPCASSRLEDIRAQNKDGNRHFYKFVYNKTGKMVIYRKICKTKNEE